MASVVYLCTCSSIVGVVYIHESELCACLTRYHNPVQWLGRKFSKIMMGELHLNQAGEIVGGLLLCNNLSCASF